MIAWMISNHPRTQYPKRVRIHCSSCCCCQSPRNNFFRTTPTDVDEGSQSSQSWDRRRKSKSQNESKLNNAARVQPRGCFRMPFLAEASGWWGLLAVNKQKTVVTECKRQRRYIGHSFSSGKWRRPKEFRLEMLFSLWSGQRTECCFHRCWFRFWIF